MFDNLQNDNGDDTCDHNSPDDLMRDDDDNNS